MKLSQTYKQQIETGQFIHCVIDSKNSAFSMGTLLFKALFILEKLDGQYFMYLLIYLQILKPLVYILCMYEYVCINVIA